MSLSLAPADVNGDDKEGPGALAPILAMTMRELFEMANSMGVKLSTIV
jgi:hypothetical protein